MKYKLHNINSKTVQLLLDRLNEPRKLTKPLTLKDFQSIINTLNDKWKTLDEITINSGVSKTKVRRALDYLIRYKLITYTKH